jgi:TIR domain
LEAAGYTVILQSWDFAAGQNFIHNMDKASKNSKRTIAVLSPAYLKATYTVPEWTAAFRQDPKGEKGTLLPVHVRDCKDKLKGLLGPLGYIDLVGKDEATARQKLLDDVREGSHRPTTPPAFPGPK